MEKTHLSHPAEKNPKRILYFDYLRMIAMFAVIILHVSAQNLRAVDIASPAWITFNVYDSLTRWSVPVFVMISGSLFLNKKQPLKKLYKKNILKLLIIIILWTLIYNSWRALLSNNHFTITDFLLNLATEPYYLWFLYMLIGLYIIFPILQQLIKNKKKTQYFLILSFIFAFCIPELLEIISLKSNLIAEVINGKIEMMRIFMVLGFTSYFILGYYLHNHTIKRKTEILIYVAGITGALFTIIATTLSSYFKGELITIFYENLTINVAAMSVAVFVFFKNHLNHTISSKRYKILQLFSRCSLGVYLIHVPILETLDSIFKINSLSFNPLFSIPALTILILFISYVISIALFKLPLIGKWIV